MNDRGALPRRRRGGGLYPLWLGALALVGLTALWMSDEAPPPAAADDAGLDAAPVAQEASEPEPTRLTWIVAPRPPLDAAVLEDCMARGGYGRAAAVGAEPVLVTHPGRIRPMRLQPTTHDGQPAVELSTPVEADARLAAALHVAAAACLYRPEATVHDPALDRRMTGADWPQLGESGGLPVRYLIAVDRVPGGWATRGLTRLGRAELAVAAERDEDAAAAQRFVKAFAGAAVVAEAGAERLERSADNTARLVDEAAARQAGWWTAPPDPKGPRRVLTRDVDGPPQPLALPRARSERPARPRRPPEKATPKRPRAAEKPAAKPSEKPAEKPKEKPARPRPAEKPSAPVPFSPAYR